MDELKKKRIKKEQDGLKKAVEIIDSVSDNFDKALKQKNLDGLYQRKFALENTIKDNEKNDVTRANARLQLKEIESSIELLEQEVNLVDEYDIEVDEAAARQFIADNPDVFVDSDLDFDHQNSVLDDLEKTLGLSSEKEK